MKTLAAVLVETGRPLELAELEIPTLKPGQVLVEIAFSGVCHTQVLEARGFRGEDRFLPHCLGHEGSGRVVEVGPGVSKVRPGQPVVLSWIKGSGMDVPGTVYAWGDRRVNAGAITTFGRFSVISENRLTPLPDGIDMRDALALGCAVPTGFGAVFNVARMQPGHTIAVFGTGGIGLCAVAAAALAGCVPIVAVDRERSKLDLARRLGATHVFDDAVAAVEQIRALCPGGVDAAIEASGVPALMAAALASVRSQGGAAVVVGNARFGHKLEIDPREFNQGKRLLGTWGGDSLPDRDYPRYARLIASNKVDLSPLLSKTYPLTAINTALDDLEHGRAGRPVIDPSQ